MNLRIWLTSAGRLVAVTLALWGLLAVLGSVVRLAPGWPPAVIAASLALAAELVLGLYRYEARGLGRRNARRLIALRLGALALLAWILVEPTYVRTVKRQFDREVAVLWDQSASMDLIDAGAAATRGQLARQAIEQSGILKELGENVRLREFHFARSPEADARTSAAGWNQATDIAAALDTVLEQIRPDELAGALVLTDGRHNRPARVEESARRFGILDAPLGLVAVGSPDPPRDAAVLAVRSPDAIHLGERMRIAADLKFDGYKGKQAKVQLTCEGALIEEKLVTIAQDQQREELRFVHLPEQGGTGGYQIEISGLEGECFPDNNAWSFETSITEARCNVLLVDDFPRWEFRYLRNLFYGRDKSVHLQWLLLNPDEAEGQSQADIAASAARPFGQSAATRLPENEAEWRKFDVIILGDLPSAAISTETWEIISRCVNERGALLVFSAGPNHMPHTLDAIAGRELLPVDPGSSLGGEILPFRASPTSEGLQHPVSIQAAGSLANQAVWANFPVMRWRHSVLGVKDGADILLIAADEEAAVAVSDPSAGLGGALDDLTNRRQREAKRALLVTRQTGHGKVAAVLTDRTWRLREGAGDIHHHRFWSNLLRWGAGPLLRAGSDRISLGTDQLTYTADDPITITARLRQADLTPIRDEALTAEVLRDGLVVASVPLTPVDGSNGLHVGKVSPIAISGPHQIRLAGSEVSARLAAEGKKSLSTGIRVVGARGPIELADTTLDRPLLEQLAATSGGKVVTPSEIASLLPLFVTTGADRLEIRQTPLWDNALIFAALALLLTAEWWLRRSAGLP